MRLRPAVVGQERETQPWNWNSWDLMVDPFSLPGEFLHTVLRTQERTLTFSILFGLFFLFVYVTLFVFGRLINEQGNQVK